jgi:phosphate acetyltransferase
MPIQTLLDIQSRARSRPRRIALCDALDERMLRAAREVTDAGIAKIVLIGEDGLLRKVAVAADVSLAGIEIISHPTDRSDLSDAYYRQRDGRVASREAAAEEILSNELLFAALLARTGAVDGVVAGSLSTTGDVIRAALKGIGLAEGISVLSSMFLMCFPAIPGFREHELALAFADGAVLPDPSSEELADIAITTASTYRTLTAIEPRVAMLSFSTKGSAHSESTEKVREATALARAKAPHLLIDGELQFDAAFVPDVAARKAKGSAVAGQANVFIFPNLDAGNIGYKIAERLGMGEAIGPVLQGLAKPMNDLSRGASVSDIVNMIAVTALQSGYQVSGFGYRDSTSHPIPDTRHPIPDV